MSGKTQGTPEEAERLVEELLRGLEPRFAELGARLAERVSARLEETGLVRKLAALARSFHPSEDDRRAESSPCSEPGCGEKARARGLCSKHYQRQRQAEKREAGLEAMPRRGSGSCSVEGCARTVYARGMCSKHFMEWVRTQKKG